LDKVVFNTEAHAFPRFELGKLFFTGWRRKQRDRLGNLVDQTSDAGVKAAGEGKREDGPAVKTVTVKPVGETAVSV
jgi:endoplasmic reticulum Man9GlcNAc2 1,2-alpha-mannosidase